ncbi:hypothetical protein [Variovorax terrae]|uniref:Uncharacterized protein n=1 Tax=Variovorax terrae TaxID=2923278 RepID=A0A9X2ASL7_9BURK|nr:hypothetical protein [Variovorax terrae]MCJ0765516.1 hypothetical protein [Variovorax terrae]
MNCDDLIDTILALGRISVLVLGMLAGTFVIYLGWKLYRDAVISKTSGEFSYKSVRVALTATGPGVFLALFGAYLLHTIVNQQVDLSQSSGGATLAPGKAPTHQQPLAGHAAGAALIRVQATAPAPAAAAPKPAPDCTIQVKTRRLYAGQPPLSQGDIRAALTLALASLEQQKRQLTDDGQVASMRSTIAIMEQLRAGVLE